MGKKASITISSVVTLVLLCGCGGGGGNGGGSNPQPTKTSPAVTINWPQRSRDFSAPSSALSVKAEFDQTGGDETATITGNRPAPLGGGPATYTTTQKLTTGSYHVTLTFYADQNESGAVVGTSGADVKVNGDGHLTKTDGTPLGVIQFAGTAAFISLEGAGLIYQGDTRQLAVSVQDANHQPLVVSPGSFTYTVTAGGDKIQITPDGKVTALAEGQATVQVGVDGLTQTGNMVIRATTQNVQTILLTTKDLAFAPGGTTVWASVPAGVAQHANEVVPINTATGAIGTGISVTDPNRLTISDDGQYLFVTSGNTVKRINTANGSATDLFTVPNTLQIKDVAAVPGGNDAVAVVTEETGKGNSDTGTYIVDTTGARPNHPIVGESVFFKPGIPSLYGIKFNLKEASVTDSGLTVTSDTNLDIVNKSYSFALGGNYLYGTNGYVIDVSNKTIAGTLPGVGNSNASKHDAIGANYASNRVFVVQGYDYPKGMLVFDASTFQEIGTVSYFFGSTGDARDMVVTGAHDIAFRTQGTVGKEAVVFIRNLP